MRQVVRRGVWYPVDRLNGAHIRRFPPTVEEFGYSTRWYPEAPGILLHRQLHARELELD